jgi:two-component system, cell cycle sensor histidine kinase and response regulator CckA
MSGSEPRLRVLPLLRPAVETAAPASDAPVTPDVWDALDVPVAVFDLDDTGALRWAAANTAQRASLGEPFESLRGRRLDGSTPGTFSRWAFEHRDALSQLDTRAVFEPEHPDPDTGRWSAHTATASRDPHTGERRVVVTTADVTERNRLASLLASTARTDALGRIAGDASHEFNNLMVAISGYAGLALRSVPGEDRAHAHLLEVLRLSDEASSRSRQLMALARRHEGARTLLRLDALVGPLVGPLQRVLREDVTLSALAAAPELWSVKADAHQIEQALLHLAIFARTTVARGAALTFEALNAPLSRDDARLLGLTAGEYVALVMRAGDAVAKPTRAYEPPPSVMRADADADLASCAGVATRHQGALAVSSTPGRGVEVRMYLPRALEKSLISGVSMATARLHGTEALLMVDPSAAREPAARALRMLGYEVLEADSADDALRLVSAREAAPIDLVVLGVGPALAASIALLRAVRGRAGDVPVLVTAPDESSVMPIALVSGRVVKLPASMPPTLLARRIRQCLDERTRGA